MKTLAAASVVLVTLCAPALADSPPPPPPLPPSESIRIRFEVRDTRSQTFDVVVNAANRCASAREKVPDRELSITACVTDTGYLGVEWFTRGPRGEYRSSSSVATAHGSTAVLGSTTGPHLVVTVQ